MTETDSHHAPPPISSLADLSGRVVVVTGSGRGIGRGIALRLSEAGATIIIAARDGSLLDGVAEEIRAVRAEYELLL